MSANTNKQKCVVCSAYLFEEDDVVYCPTCGAPHHRDCYTALGHCALEELHGTEQQYSQEKITEQEIKKEQIQNQNSDKTDSKDTVCKMCSATYDSQYPRCPECGAPNFSQINRFENFDFLGGVPADYKFSENVTADNAKRFVANNTHRYITKFATLTDKNRTSWNWMAFFFPCGWFLSRKMYKNGIISGILILISSLLSFPFNQTVMAAMPQDNIPYPELASIIFDMLPEISGLSIALAFAGLLLELGIRIYAALFSDYNYKKFVISSIKKIKSENDDIEFEYRKKGGINPFLIIIGEMTIKFIGNFIVNLL